MTLAFSCVDHVKGFGAELLPLLALGLAGRLGDFDNDCSAVGLLAVVGLPCGQLSGGHVGGDRGAGHCSVFGVPGLPAVPILYTIGSPWQPCSVKADASASTGPCVQWIELTPDQVTQRVIHVVMPGILVRIALVRVALQL